MLRKQLFYLSSEGLWASLCQRGATTDSSFFAADAAGLQAFAAWLEQQGQTPAWLLADLVEEDFQVQQLPHVGGKAGRNLRERRLSQLYRETPYRRATILGRAADGRRDDQVLLSALTNPALLAPWLEAMEAAATPLAGIYSAALLSSELVQRLLPEHEHLLLVTPQPAGLRQSYFRNGALKFSRLTPAVGGEHLASGVAAETARAQQFLTSVRLIGRGDVLHTAILAPAAQIAALAALCQDGPETAFNFLPLEEVAPQFGADPAAPLADGLLLARLARARQPGHYSRGEVRRHFQLWRARISLYASSAVIGVAGLIWTVANLISYGTAESHAAELRAEAARKESAYQASMSTMPPIAARTVNMKAAVSIEKMLAEQGPAPEAMLQLVSAALEQSPQIRLTQLDWQVQVAGLPAQTDSAATAGAAAMPGFGADASAQAVAPMPALLLGIPRRPPQTLRLEAEVLVQQDDYRAVLDSMNGFAQALARTPRMAVQIGSLPFDVRSNVKLSGRAGSSGNTVEDRAKFTLNLVWNP
ncbi:hypothetical protein [Massilia sp. NR 4-1]|uniref:hypothetical protein n=1 Tax=Massilia sp. NR 4-1 TaxID=1678028 RepID=UPI00067E0597|nr:hypothetical protein [Massilia sp. NR 4-1]AKU21367.1 hypothetical protein ACZ75_07615 [Massilia sp. NR 4-1]